MMVFKYPVITITLFLALGILANYSLQPATNVLYILSGFFLLLVIAAYWFSNKTLIQKPYFALSVYFLSFTLGMVAHAAHYSPGHTSHYTHYLKPGKTPVIKGLIVERLKPNAFSEKYYFNVTAINRQHASGKLLLTIPKDSLNRLLHAGDEIIIADDLRPITKSLNPYQFDYAEYMAKQNVYHQLQLKGNYFVSGQVHTSDYYIETLRSTLINSFGSHNLDAEVTTIIKALLLGQRQDMDKETTDNYTNAGVVHILAVSGLHITILFAILNFIFKPLHRFNRKGRLVSLLAILSFIWVFALLSGLSASVVRAVVMFSFVSIGLYFNRNSNIYNSIAISMLVLLLAKPNFLFDVGFQLSYAAVFAIVWLQPIYKKVKVSKYRAVNYIADTVLISLVAQIGVLPLSLYYFNQFSVTFFGCKRRGNTTFYISTCIGLRDTAS